MGEEQIAAGSEESNLPETPYESIDKPQESSLEQVSDVVDEADDSLADNMAADESESTAEESFGEPRDDDFEED